MRQWVRPRSAPWGVTVFVLVIGAFMAVLDTSIVNIAIPALESVFGATTSQVQWVVTIYMLTLGVVVPAAGYLADRYGARRIYMLSLVAFALGSALSGLAWNLPVLIIFRVLQALGGGLIMPVTMSMLYRLVPRERIGTAMGFWGLAIIVAPAVGPTLGGYLVEYVNWRFIFYINVPIGVLGLLLTMAYVPELSGPRPGRFDVWGFVLAAGGLFGLLFAFSEGETWGWTSEPIVLLLAASVWLLVLFGFWELRTADPLINLRVLGAGSFSVAGLLMIVVMVGLFSGIFYIPLFLQTIAGFGALKTGLLLMPQALAMAVIMPVAGRLYDRFGGRPLAIIGLSVLAAATYQLRGLSANTPLPMLVGWLTVRGIGIGLSMMPINTAGMSAVRPQDLGSATALSNIVQRVGASFGLALMTALLEVQDRMHVQQLAAAYSYNAPPGQAVYTGLADLLSRQGLAPGQANAVGLTMLDGMIQQQGFVMGLDDILVATAAITVLGVGLAFGLTTHRLRGDAGPVRGGIGVAE